MATPNAASAVKPDPSLNEVLASLGYTTRPTHPGAGQPWASVKDILRGDEVVFFGNAGDVWQWLRDTAQVRS